MIRHAILTVGLVNKTEIVFLWIWIMEQKKKNTEWIHVLKSKSWINHSPRININTWTAKNTVKHPICEIMKFIFTILDAGVWRIRKVVGEKCIPEADHSYGLKMQYLFWYVKNRDFFTNEFAVKLEKQWNFLPSPSTWMLPPSRIISCGNLGSPFIDRILK